MTLDPDRLLFEQVFQRLVNLLAGRVTSFDLARSCLIGAPVFQGAILLLFAVRGHWLNFAAMAMIDFLVVLGAVGMIAAVNRTERQFLAGILHDPFSLHSRLLRWFWLVWVSVFTTTAILLPSQEVVFSDACLGCQLAAAYFKDCIPAPPRRRRLFPKAFKKAVPAWPATPSSTSRTCSSVRAT